MSVIKTLATAMFGICLMSLGACASTPVRFNPATGQQVSVIESGSCTSGQIQDGKSCLCERDAWSGNYRNCAFATIGAPSRPAIQISPMESLARTLEGSAYRPYGYYGRESLDQLYVSAPQCRRGVYCCPRPRYGERTHPLCSVRAAPPRSPYRRPN